MWLLSQKVAQLDRVLEEAKTLLYGSKDEAYYSNILSLMMNDEVLH